LAAGCFWWTAFLRGWTVALARFETKGKIHCAGRRDGSQACGNTQEKRKKMHSESVEEEVLIGNDDIEYCI
jgi:hypothetical protein